MSTPPTRPGVPPSQPPRRYPFGGRALAVLVILYALGWWFFLVDSIAGNAPAASVALGWVLVESLALFALDWRGYTSLYGLVQWASLPTPRRVAIVCAFAVGLPLLPAIYFVRAISQHYAVTQQRPRQQLRNGWQW
jgi:hypothetical protein